MSAELELRWLKTEDSKGTVRRFAEFCKEDVKEQAELEGFDIDKYQSAVKLVMRKLDNSLSIDKMFNPNQDDNPTEAEKAGENNNAD